MRTTTDHPRRFTESERNRFRNLLKLASESPYAGEREAALAAAERMATARGMSLHEAASVGAPPPRRDGLFAPRRDPESEARERAQREFARFVHATDAWIQADKARREAAFEEARRRGLDADQRRAERSWQPPRTGGTRRDPHSHAEVLLSETRLPMQEIAAITGLDIYTVVGMKLRMRGAA